MDIEFWNQERTKQALNEALSFMTGDRNFKFVFTATAIMVTAFKPIFLYSVSISLIYISEERILGVCHGFIGLVANDAQRTFWNCNR